MTTLHLIHAQFGQTEFPESLVSVRQNSQSCLNAGSVSQKIKEKEEVLALVCLQFYIPVNFTFLHFVEKLGHVPEESKPHERSKAAEKNEHKSNTCISEISMHVDQELGNELNTCPSLVKEEESK